MSDPKHLRRRRARGFRLFGGRGRRRRTVDDRPASRRDLAWEARRAAAAQARGRVLRATVASLVVVGLAVVASLALLPRGPGGGGVEPPGPEGDALLLVGTNGEGRATTIALVAVRPGTASQVVLLPPALLDTLPGFGDGLLAQTTDFGGTELTRLTVVNLLGVRVERAAALPPGWAEALGGPLEVDLSAPLLVTEGGTERVVATTGIVQRDAATVETLLTVQGTEDQLAWLQRQGDVLRALLGAMADDLGLARRLETGLSWPAGSADLLVTAGADPDLVLTGVPASRLAVGGGTERYQLSGEEAAAFVDGRLSFLRLRPEPRPRVEVLNGNGRVGTTRAVARALIGAGFRVVKTDNADRFTYEATQLVAQGREHQEAALEAVELLGRGEVVLELRRPSGVVDLTIIVGKDIPAEEG